MVIVVTILMMIVNVQDQSCQTQQKSAEFQQVTKRDKLIHHTDHLPSVTMTVGAKIRSKPPTVFRYALRVLVYHICRGLSNLRNVKKALDSGDISPLAIQMFTFLSILLNSYGSSLSNTLLNWDRKCIANWRNIREIKWLTGWRKQHSYLRRHWTNFNFR